MDNGLTLSRETDSELNGGKGDKPLAFFLKDVFLETFPYYLALGMSYDEFWNEDVKLVEAYRKADELKRDRVNQQLWLQGAYIYDALIKTIPIANAPYVKGKMKIEPYLSKPFDFANNEEDKEVIEAKKSMNKNKVFMETFMAKFNRKEESNE